MLAVQIMSLALRDEIATRNFDKNGKIMSEFYTKCGGSRKEKIL